MSFHTLNFEICYALRIEKYAELNATTIISRHKTSYAGLKRRKVQQSDGFTLQQKLTNCYINSPEHKCGATDARLPSEMKGICRTVSISAPNKMNINVRFVKMFESTTVKCKSGVGLDSWDSSGKSQKPLYSKPETLPKLRTSLLIQFCDCCLPALQQRSSQA